MQDVVLHQCLPLSSIYCFPVPGGSLRLRFFILPSFTRLSLDFSLQVSEITGMVTDEHLSFSKPMSVTYLESCLFVQCFSEFSLYFTVVACSAKTPLPLPVRIQVTWRIIHSSLTVDWFLILLFFLFRFHVERWRLHVVYPRDGSVSQSCGREESTLVAGILV